MRTVEIPKMNKKLKEAIRTVVNAGLDVQKNYGPSVAYGVNAALVPLDNYTDDTDYEYQYYVYTETNGGKEDSAVIHDTFDIAIEALLAQLPHGDVLKLMEAI